MVLKIGITLLVLLVALMIYVAFQPSEYSVKRKITIQAPAEKIFPYLNSAKLMDAWNPWIELDPQVKTTYSGPDAGVGSKSSWVSEGKLGVGSATIIEVKANELVRTQLEYTKPMVMSQLVEYTIVPTANGNEVTWGVSGKSSFIGRMLCACKVMDMDKMIGEIFEKGLARLKTLMEKQN